VLGERPAGTPAHLARVGFVVQDAPACAGLSVAGPLVTARDASTTGPRQFDTTKASHARMYDY
jgi:hypothetical protein